MFKLIVSTANEISLTVLRLALGIVMFPHGSQKMFGWFGGHGFSATMNSFTERMEIPAIFAFLAIMAEFLGSLGLIFGFLSRIAAFGIGVVMVVAIGMVHWNNGFFMNWGGNQKGEGFEFHVLALSIAIAIMIRGAGAYSIDRKLAEKTSNSLLGH